jgi:hypothetical protein
MITQRTTRYWAYYHRLETVKTAHRVSLTAQPLVDSVTDPVLIGEPSAMAAKSIAIQKLAAMTLLHWKPTLFLDPILLNLVNNCVQQILVRLSPTKNLLISILPFRYSVGSVAH